MELFVLSAWDRKELLRPNPGNSLDELRFALAIVFLGPVYGLPAALVTGIASLDFRKRWMRKGYVVACSLTGAVTSAISVLVVGPAWPWLGFAFSGGAAALVCALLTAPLED
ncbi:MAG: hypothetical protein ACK56C_02785 [Alphaproteobacteria bacterium]